MKKIDRTTPLLKSIKLEPVAVHKPTADHSAFEMILELQGDTAADISTVRALIDSHNLKEVIQYLTQQMRQIEDSQTPPSGPHH